MTKFAVPLSDAVAKLVAATEEQGEWKQVDLARRLRISQKHMNRVWKGHTLPSLDLLEDWARLVGYEVVTTVELQPR